MTEEKGTMTAEEAMKAYNDLPLENQVVVVLDHLGLICGGAMAVAHHPDLPTDCAVLFKDEELARKINDLVEDRQKTVQEESE
jgi:hypothetical protein